MRTARLRPNIVAESVIENIDFARRRLARRVAPHLRLVGVSATRNAGGGTGTGAKANGTKNAAPAIGSVNLRSSTNSAGNASTAASTTRASSISITLTPARKIGQHTAATQLLSAWGCGQKKWLTFKSFARTVTASKLTQRRGVRRIFSADIACRRIEEATKQPDMFVETTAPAPKQEALSLA